MPTTNHRALRREKASDLRLLGDVLQRKGICLDSGPLMSAASQCATNTPHGGSSWGYEVVGLQFRSELRRNIFPAGVVNVSVVLSFNVSGMLGRSVSLGDSFRQMTLDLTISGLEIKGGESREVRACWHLDRDIGDGSHEGIHPLFHFQHGGKLMESFQDKLGSTVLMDSPRLIHPPMDTYIAVDFVLANFLPVKWAEIRSEGDFASRLGKSYSDYWSPFFEAIAEAWKPFTQTRLNSYEVLCPQLLVARERLARLP